MREVREYHNDVTAAIIKLDLRVQSLERRLTVLIIVLLALIFTAIGYLVSVIL